MKMKFFRKTLSFFIVPVMIPILILGTLSGITLNRYMRQGIDERYEDRLESHRTRIDAMMSELDWLNMNLSNNPSIQFRLKNMISKCKDGIPANTCLLYTSYKSLWATVKYVLIAVPGKLVFALIIAMILNMKLKCINFYRTVYYLPSILGGSVAISILWKFLFSKNGTVNTFLAHLHIPALDWLGSPNLALVTMGLLVVWQFGSSMVLFLAALRCV